MQPPLTSLFLCPPSGRGRVGRVATAARSIRPARSGGGAREGRARGVARRGVEAAVGARRDAPVLAAASQLGADLAHLAQRQVRVEGDAVPALCAADAVGLVVRYEDGFEGFENKCLVRFDAGPRLRYALGLDGRCRLDVVS